MACAARPGFIFPFGGQGRVFALYPLIPWIGVMARATRSAPLRWDHASRQFLVRSGLAVTIGFVFCADQIYGDHRYGRIRTPTKTVPSFLAVSGRHRRRCYSDDDPARRFSFWRRLMRLEVASRASSSRRCRFSSILHGISARWRRRVSVAGMRQIFSSASDLFHRHHRPARALDCSPFICCGYWEFCCCIPPAAGSRA